MAELFEDPASIEIWRNETPASPCSAKSRSAASTSCNAVAGAGPRGVLTTRSLRIGRRRVVEGLGQASPERWGWNLGRRLDDLLAEVANDTGASGHTDSWRDQNRRLR